VRLVIFALVAATAAAVAQSIDAPARSTCHPTTTTPLLRANLDRDREVEEVTATNLSCAHEMAFGVQDECDGRPNHHRLRGSGFRNERRVFNANARADGDEFLYILRQPETRAPDLGTSALIHLVKRTATGVRLRATSFSIAQVRSRHRHPATAAWWTSTWRRCS
jgi:hypothetical protein